MAGCILRADLQSITTGRYVIVLENTVMRPSWKKSQGYAAALPRSLVRKLTDVVAMAVVVVMVVYCTSACSWGKQEDPVLPAHDRRLRVCGTELHLGSGADRVMRLHRQELHYCTQRHDPLHHTPTVVWALLCCGWVHDDQWLVAPALTRARGDCLVLDG